MTGDVCETGSSSAAELPGWTFGGPLTADRSHPIKCEPTCCIPRSSSGMKTILGSRMMIWKQQKKWGNINQLGTSEEDGQIHFEVTQIEIRVLNDLSG